MAPGPSRFGIFDFRPTEELRPAKWGSTVVLRSSNSQRPMSALGQKRTFTDPRLMSALPSKADMDQHGRNVCFVPKADMCNYRAAKIHLSSLDYFVGSD